MSKNLELLFWKASGRCYDTCQLRDGHQPSPWQHSLFFHTGGQKSCPQLKEQLLRVVETTSLRCFTVVYTMQSEQKSSLHELCLLHHMRTMLNRHAPHHKTCFQSINVQLKCGIPFLKMHLILEQWSPMCYYVFSFIEIFRFVFGKADFRHLKFEIWIFYRTSWHGVRQTYRRHFSKGRCQLGMPM